MMKWRKKTMGAFGSSRAATPTEAAIEAKSSAEATMYAAPFRRSPLLVGAVAGVVVTLPDHMAPATPAWAAAFPGSTPSAPIGAALRRSML